LGIQIKTLNYLLENIDSYFSIEKKDIFIGELGDQMIKRSCFNVIKSLGYPKVNQIIDTGYGVKNGMGAICSSKDLFKWYGYNHISFDLNTNHGALKYDFSRDISKYNAYFDIFTNIGSSEHIGEINSIQGFESGQHPQYYCFKNIHDMTKINGIMIHMVPLAGNWEKHGRFKYTLDFFDSLALLNNYEVHSKEIFEYASEIKKTGMKCILITLIKTFKEKFIDHDTFYNISGLIDSDLIYI